MSTTENTSRIYDTYQENEPIDQNEVDVNPCDPKETPADIEKRLDGIPGKTGWKVGECVIYDKDRDLKVHRVFDKEWREHWLYLGSWNEWERVSELWLYLSKISQTLMNLSPFFRLFGPMLPRGEWFKTSEGFLGSFERRSNLPYFEHLSDTSQPILFANIVQLTGFLRLLQLGENLFSNGDSHKIIDQLEERTLVLIEEVEERIPEKSIFTRWRSFLQQNAKSVSYGGELSLSFGPYASTCFAFTNRSALLIDFPFLLKEDITHIDLCRIIYEMRFRDIQDRKCFVDAYFNHEVPSYFFSLLAHYQVMVVLEKLRSCPVGSHHEKSLIDELEGLSRDYEHFRTPVPRWYK